MKKRILAMILSVILTANICSCNDMQWNSDKKKTLDKTDNSTTERPDNPPINNNEIPDVATIWMESLYGKQYTYVYSQVRDNPYDKWLESKKVIKYALKKKSIGNIYHFGKMN